MAHLPRNLPKLLRDAGLRVVEVDNWLFHGRPGAFAPVGVNNHHTGASAKGWSLAKELAYARWMFRQGRSDLPAPLCQIALGRSGTVYVGAAGRANHAGTARASGSVAAGDGNALYIGIEWMLSGTEAIPDDMMEAGVTLNAVLTKKVTKTSEQTITSHYLTSVTGKWDIGDPNGVVYKDKRVLDIAAFRARAKGRGTNLRKIKKAGKKNVVVLSWNMKVGRKKAAVRQGLVALIKANKRPAVVALLEARGYRGLIKSVATALRYRVHQPVDHGPKAAGVRIRAAGSSAILTRRNVRVRETGSIRTAATWRGPQGAVQEGRILPWVVAMIDGKWTLVVAVHMPTGKKRGQNTEAWDEVMTAIERLAKKGLPIILIGDWNTGHGQNDARSPRALAKRFGGRVAAAGVPVDYALIKGHPFSATKAAKRGSDHHAIRLVRKKK